VTDKQPKALWLAELLDGDTPMHCEQAATELRRLYEVNAELVEALKQIIDLPEDSRIHYKAARRAITKATGEQQ
jgi:hypothetical protein